jgi:hypothetical protein
MGRYPAPVAGRHVRACAASFELAVGLPEGGAAVDASQIAPRACSLADDPVPIADVWLRLTNEDALITPERFDLWPSRRFSDARTISLKFSNAYRIRLILRSPFFDLVDLQRGIGLIYPSIQPSPFQSSSRIGTYRGSHYSCLKIALYLSN